MWRNLLKNNAAYAVGSVAYSAALFLLVPYLVQRLTPEAFGAYAIFEVAIVLLNMIVLAGLDVGAMRYYWFEENQAKRAQLFGNVFLAVLVWGGVLAAVGLAILAVGIQIDLPDATRNITWILLICWVEGLIAVILALFRVREQAVTFVFLSVGRMALFVGTTVWLVQIGMGVTGVLIARFAAAIVALGVALLFGVRHLSPRPDWKLLRRVAKYGLPLLPMSLATYILFASDRYVLKSVSTLEIVAVYTFAYKVASALNVMVSRPFAMDWAPRRFKIAAGPNAPHKYAQVLVLYLLAATSFALLVIAITPAIYTWFAPPVYARGIGIVPVILLAYIVFGLSYPLNIGMMLKDKTNYLAAIGWLSAVVCLGLNLWWIPLWGMTGAAWATAIAYGFYSAGIAWLSLRLYPVPYRLDHLVAVVGTGVAGYAGIRFIHGVVSEDQLLVSSVTKLAWLTVVTAPAAFWIGRSLLVERAQEPTIHFEEKVVSSG